MAHVRYSNIITDISGSVGGATFQKNLYGNTLRSRPSPIKTPSANQLKIRQYMQQCHYKWRTMSQAERNLWNSFILYSNPTTKHNTTVLLTGHDLFIKYNIHRLLRAIPIITTFQYITMPQIPTDFNLKVSAGVFSATFNTDFITTDLNVTIKLSSPRINSLQFSYKGLRNISYNVLSVVQIDLTGSYASIFANLPSVSDYLHYSIQFWHLNSPIFSQIITGIKQVTS